MPRLRLWNAKRKQWWQQEQQVLLATVGVASAIILVRATGLLESWELSALDRLFQLRRESIVENRTIVVGIGEKQIEGNAKGQISDRSLVQLLEKLEAAQPRAIGLDIYRDIPSEPGNKALEALYFKLSNFVGITQLEDQDSPEVSAPPLLESKQQVGFNNVVLDADGRVRRGLLYWHEDGQAQTSFALKLALLYLEAEKIQPREAAINPKYLQLDRAVFRPFAKNNGGYVRVDDRGYQFIGNFFHPEAIEKVTMADVLAGKVPPEKFRDRVVLIGSMAPSLKDLIYIPYSTKVAGVAEPIYGVELHANFVAQLLAAAKSERPLIQVLPDWLESFWILLWSGIGAWMAGKIRSVRLFWSMLLLANVVLLGAVYANFRAGWWLPSIPPLMGLMVSSIIVSYNRAYQREQFQRSKDFFQSAIDAIADPIYIKDIKHRWVVLNQAFCHLSGYSLEALLGKSEYDILPPQEAKIFRAQDNQVFQTSSSIEQEEYFTDVQGTTYRVATKRSLHQDAAGNLFLIGSIRDITERKRVEDELRRTTVELSRSNQQLKLSRDRLHRLAYYDSLTGLPNRKHFYDSLTQSLARARESNGLMGLLYLDLDGFKEVNDSLGHDFGDLLLEAVASRISHCVRTSDVVARLGGDEFTVILPGIHGVSDLSIVVGKILKTLAQPFALKGETISVTASIGSSIYPDDGQTEEVLLKKADTAMFEIKRLGRQLTNNSK